MSSNIKYTDCFNEVLPELPGVPVALAENAIRNAVIDFCKRSKVWRHWADVQTIVAGENTYDLEPPCSADVAGIVSLKADGEGLEPIALDDADAQWPDWRTQAGPITNYLQTDTTQVVLVRLPDATIQDGLEMTLALMPRRTSVSFPAWIWNQYYEGIAAGAKARLMAMPKKPWTDQQTALFYQSKFDAAAGAASADAARSLTRARTRTTSQH